MKRIKKLVSPFVCEGSLTWQLDITAKINEIIDELNTMCPLPDVGEKKCENPFAFVQMNKHIQEFENEYRWLAKYFCTDYDSNKELYPIMSMPYMTVVEIMRKYNYDEQHNEK